MEIAAGVIESSLAVRTKISPNVFLLLSSFVNFSSVENCSSMEQF